MIQKNKKSIVNGQLSIVNKNGFSLMELMVSMFVFSVIMAAVVGVFAQSASSFRRAKDIQRNLEDAQYAMNLMAKTIRTSSVEYDYTENLDIYDYSQSKCIRYSHSDETKKIKYGEISADDPDSCSDLDSITLSDLISGYVNSVSFDVTPSEVPTAPDPGIVGKVTISMEVCATADCEAMEKDKVRIQTTVSLRDYGVSGL